jgi:predicted N-acyltransferase
MKYRFQWFDSFASLPFSQQTWDPMTIHFPHPFFSWTWLYSLEASGSVTPKTGWQPAHVIGWKEDSDQPLVAGVFYIRNTSWGELFFDFQWAQAAEQLQLPYYPKLVGTIPATPVQGYQFLISPSISDEEKELLMSALFTELKTFAWDQKLNQIALLFLDPSIHSIAQLQGYGLWAQHRFEWQNNHYQSFDQFQNTFTKNQRKNIRKERIAMADQGLSMEFLNGSETDSSDWNHMNWFYNHTNAQFGPYAAKFLNNQFFDLLGSFKPSYITLAKVIESKMSIGNEKPLAMAFLAQSSNRMFGRYWGMAEERKFLHFNLCYYWPQEFCINNGIEFFDPGVGSFHKARRGFVSKPVYSAHLFRNDQMQHIWDTNVPRLNNGLLEQIEEINNEMPQKPDIFGSNQIDLSK